MDALSLILPQRVMIRSIHKKLPQRLGVAMLFFANIVTPVWTQNLEFSENFLDWIDVSDEVVRDVETDPLFMNSCGWEIVSRDGGAHPKIGLFEDWQDLTDHRVVNLIKSGNIQKMFRQKEGFLFVLSQDDESELAWVPDNGNISRVQVKAHVNQIQWDEDRDKILIGVDPIVNGVDGVLQFSVPKGNEALSGKSLVRHQFGRVYGLAPNWNGGVLVYSHLGWWKISAENQITEVGLPKNLSGNARTIGADDGFVYVGGEYFVREIDIQTGRIRVLIPSPMFLNAMMKMPPKDFISALDGHRVGPRI